MIDQTAQVRFDVELVNGELRLLFIGTVDGEASVIAVPITAVDARALASRLLGGAAVADPQGHQVVLDQIREMFLTEVTRLATTPTPTTH